MKRKKPQPPKEKTRPRIGLAALERENANTLTVTVRIDGWEYVVNGVPLNIIRCAIGENDLCYLLGEQQNERWQPGDDPEDEHTRPGNDESQCFSLMPSEFKDCLKHGELQRR